jgi:predicted SAM-dependent methyltransferase
MLKLNVGAGNRALPDFANLDRKNKDEAYPLAQWIPMEGGGGYRHNFADESVDEVRASHILEHFSHTKTVDVVREWVRVLKVGGILKIAVPDFDRCVDQYRNRASELPVEGVVMGGHVNDDDCHGALFNRRKLVNLMEAAGLIDIEDWTSETDDCASYPISLNLKGRKQPKPSLSKIKVKAIESVPRLGWQDHFASVQQALQPLGIKPIGVIGAFWGQCLERGIDKLLEGDPDWILTLDFDTIFNTAHVKTLLKLAVNNPDVDAIAPIQMKRGGGMALACVNDQNNNEVIEHVPADKFVPSLLKVEAGHFGLTLLRASKLRELPHPWFWGQPNHEGKWEDGRLDDDVFFWRKWRDAGNSLYLATRVAVGHLETVVTWPGPELDTVYQPVERWNEALVPPQGAWQ